MERDVAARSNRCLQPIYLIEDRGYEIVPGRIVELCCKEGFEMLLLSRKRGEELVIGNGIRVTVLEMRGDRVKLGVVAPAEVPIHRQEVHSQGRRSTHGFESTRPAAGASTIAEMAVERLRNSHYKALRRVSCEWKHGVLFLRGRLFSVHEKQVAQETVAGVRGVTKVVNEIEVN